LHRFDVIVASMCHDVPPAALESIESAVKDGTGLHIRQCLGGRVPGLTNPLVLRLRGFSRGVPGFSTGTLECTVVGEHSILGSLSGKRDVSLTVWSACSYGELIHDVSKPLLMLKSTGTLPGGEGKPLPDWVKTDGNVLYTSALGRGRIVSSSFGGTTPPNLQDATGGRFTSRAIHWLANREVE
jgi:hypothetical protein